MADSIISHQNFEISGIRVPLMHSSKYSASRVKFKWEVKWIARFLAHLNSCTCIIQNRLILQQKKLSMICKNLILYVFWQRHFSIRSTGFELRMRGKFKWANNLAIHSITCLIFTLARVEKCEKSSTGTIYLLKEKKSFRPITTVRANCI